MDISIVKSDGNCYWIAWIVIVSSKQEIIYSRLKETKFTSCESIAAYIHSCIFDYVDFTSIIKNKSSRSDSSKSVKSTIWKICEFWILNRSVYFDSARCYEVSVICYRERSENTVKLIWQEIW